jgi:hypothetical protein
VNSPSDLIIQRAAFVFEADQGDVVGAGGLPPEQAHVGAHGIDGGGGYAALEAFRAGKTPLCGLSTGGGEECR